MSRSENRIRFIRIFFSIWSREEGSDWLGPIVRIKGVGDELITSWAYSSFYFFSGSDLGISR